MARCAIVSSTELAKHERWDAAFFLGDVSVEKERIARERKRLKDALATIAKAKQSMKEILVRIRKMKEDGTVQMLEGKP